MKAWAASKWYLRISHKKWPGVKDDAHYFYHDTKEEAVADLIDRERKAIAVKEKRVRLAKANLRTFMKKYGISETE